MCHFAGITPDWILSFLGLSGILPLPMWTLTVELLGSALMPVIMWAGRRRLTMAFMSLGLLVLSFQTSQDSIAGRLLVYPVDFVLGAIVAREHVMAARLFRSRGAAIVWATLSAIVALSCRFIGDWADGSFYHSPYPNIVEGVACTILLAAVVSGPRRFPLLADKSLLWLGDVSYSLYLLHMPLLFLLAGVMGEMLGQAWLFENYLAGSVLLLALALAVSLPASMISYLYVEIPGIRFGKAVAARFASLGRSTGR